MEELSTARIAATTSKALSFFRLGRFRFWGLGFRASGFRVFGVYRRVWGFMELYACLGSKSGFRVCRTWYSSHAFCFGLEKRKTSTRDRFTVSFPCCLMEWGLSRVLLLKGHYGVFRSCFGNLGQVAVSGSRQLRFRTKFRILGF